MAMHTASIVTAAIPKKFQQWKNFPHQRIPQRQKYLQREDERD
jgi:hypothetical protein